jgi:hypothetical protein
MRLDVIIGLGLFAMALYTIYAVVIADHLYVG